MALVRFTLCLWAAFGGKPSAVLLFIGRLVARGGHPTGIVFLPPRRAAPARLPRSSFHCAIYAPHQHHLDLDSTSSISPLALP